MNDAADRLRIAIAVHGRFHAFDLAAALHRIADVRQVATTYPQAIAYRFLPREIPVRTAPLLEAVRRVRQKVGIGPRPDAYVTRAFARFAARTLPTDADVFVGWSGAALEAIRVARQRGMLAVVERGSTHILHQQKVLTRVCTTPRSNIAATDPEIVARELAEYDEAHAIAVPSTFAADTFVAHGIDRAKLLINPYGVDADRFAPRDRPPNETPVVLFVGGVGRRKGVPELLAAVGRLRSQAELRLAGPVEPDLAAAAQTAAANVRFLGTLDRNGVVDAMQAADIFCLPSHEEGLSLSLLQAMAAGLPVVATAETGAGDVVTDGRDGLIVEAGNVDALAAALDTLSADPDRRRRMGEAARARALEQTWDAYGRRALAGYKRALADAGLTPQPA